MTQILRFRSSSLTHPGLKRSHNEDFVAFFEPGDPEVVQSSGRLYVVADGVGGASEGERASQYAAEKVLSEYYLHPDLDPGERLKKAMRQASQEIFEYAEAEGSYRRMATTMVTAAIRSDRLTVANVGDSRAYLVRDGKAWQITTDHNTVGEMVEGGLMSEEEAMNSKAKNRLTRSLGAEPDAAVDLFPDIPLRAGDKVLLCTDGLTRYTLSQDIASLTASGQPEEVTARLVDFANQKGGVDNVSVILIAIDQAEQFEDTVTLPRGQLPAQVDWDSLATQPVPQRRNRLVEAWWRFSHTRDVKKLALPIALGVILILSIILSALLGWNRPQNEDVVQGLRTTTVPALQTADNLPGSIPGTITPNSYEMAVIPNPGDVITSSIETTSIPDIEITSAFSETIATTDPSTRDVPPTGTLDDRIPDGQWCVYVVATEGPSTISEIIRKFSNEGNPEELRNYVYEATGGIPWDDPLIWKDGWETTLPEGAKVALAFISYENDCLSNGGEVLSKPDDLMTFEH